MQLSAKGFGSLYKNNGTLTYSGEFEDRQYSGFGFLRQDKFTYSGSFVKGKKHGKGVLKCFDQDDLVEY